MKYTGKSLTVGDHIDTDAIIPAIYLVSSDPTELGSHCMDGLDPKWKNKIAPGSSLLVAGRNFGCGSSREHAPVALIGAGIPLVIAHSFARIFYRNAFNMGLVPIEVGDAYSEFHEGDAIEVDMPAGKIINKTTGKSITFPPLPESMRAILEAGGLAAFVRKRLDGKV
ncbi:MAG: 3-isopropylmalate dehydratase small subunit [Desulfovibrio sp.]|jgi:3-isopropylmalate/(R)-2-methylmalate dehydratase small subunit|nr:3-isopropylmalate dehydratase small subunit [Desulfovibrio sp.]